MKLLITSIGVAGLVLTACHHGAPEPDPIVALEDNMALEQFATAAVYEAHPTRALVDKFDVLSTEANRNIVRIEMTGSPTARKIYKLSIIELEEGGYQVESLEMLQ